MSRLIVGDFPFIANEGYCYCNKITVHDVVNQNSYTHMFEPDTVTDILTITGSDRVLFTSKDRSAELWDIDCNRATKCMRTATYEHGWPMYWDGRLWVLTTEHDDQTRTTTIYSSTLVHDLPIRTKLVSMNKSTDIKIQFEPIIDLDGSLIFACAGYINMHKLNCDYIDAKIVRTTSMHTPCVSINGSLYYGDFGGMWVCLDHRSKSTVSDLTSMTDEDLNITQMNPIDDNVFVSVSSLLYPSGVFSSHIIYHDIRNMTKPVETNKIDYGNNQRGVTYDVTWIGG